MQYDGVQQLDQSNISQFAKKSSLSGQGQFGPNLSKNIQPCLMIHSLRICWKFCGMMMHQTNVALVTFPKISFFTPVAIQAKMVQPYSHDLLCDNFFEMTKHDGIQQLHQSNVGQHFQKIPVSGNNSHPVWAKIMQSSVLLFAF